MATTVVQDGRVNDATAVTSQTYSLSTFTPALSNTTAHNPLIVGIACVTKTRTISSITDSASNTGWVQIDGGGGSTSGNLFFWWNPNPASSISSITVNLSGTSKTQVFLTEVLSTSLSGTINNAGAAHHSTQVTAATTTPSDSVTTTGGGTTWCVACLSAATAASTIASPFTLETNISGGGQGLNIFGGYADGQSAGTITSSYTQTSQVCSTVIVAFDIPTAATRQKNTHGGWSGQRGGARHHHHPRLPRAGWR